MKIYIASSWKNQHAVEMMTTLLRAEGHEVFSFVENNHGEGHAADKPMPFEEWVHTDQADRSFIYDTNSAMFSDLVIYIAPSGKDAAAECGMAWAKGVPILGLYAKGEDLGLMRKMMQSWHDRYTDILDAVRQHASTLNPFACFGKNMPHRMDFDTQEEFNERMQNYQKWENENCSAKLHQS